ncbi:hypothetical protein BZM26_27080 [Paraburkholderia strydomiana]|nr:hypothetical protein BZM26_27080 [Paraburkholderia strydomiana]
MRFFYGTFAIVTFATYYVSRAVVLRSVRELLFIALGGLVGYVLIGLLIFHQPSSLVDYIVINNQLNFGNSVDMTLDVGNTSRTFIAAALLLLSMNVFVLWRRRVLFLTINALVIIMFKVGFSRTDHYLPYFIVPAAVTACMMLFEGSWRGRIIFWWRWVRCTIFRVTPLTLEPLRVTGFLLASICRRPIGSAWRLLTALTYCRNQCETGLATCPSTSTPITTNMRLPTI